MIKYTIERRNRRTTTIQVHRDGSVRVLAPKFSTQKQIERQVAGRADWIRKKQAQFATLPEKVEHRFESGEVFLYLGARYKLLIEQGKPAVKLDSENLLMSAPVSWTPERRGKLLREWYRDRSREIFAERIEVCVQEASVIGIKKAPEWKSRVLKRSWGSCSSTGKLNLNLELVSAPVELIDYVILHELCHLKEHNHSPRFYKLMSRVCPDWKHRRKELNAGYETKLI
ncbi:MAG: SprT family zinc-dependent metalloprotease [Spirochaetales bacterium]|uniref:SprT family zinc-dependent metalloprotease n=1 Tax=Candidatus Thalassospirochaeta sargassi TaxID=3119039 RepID=A0AAJ1ICD5_9SPIO|nr:SprT family zinc-dependent metalloprotease [Spirochaetales bacterium]